SFRFWRLSEWFIFCLVCRAGSEISVNSAGLGGFELFDRELPTIETLPVNIMVLEVKFTEFLPEIVKRALRCLPNEMTAASKFVLCCDVAQGVHGLDSASYLPLNKYLR
ncbi:MAG: hypothetical protein PHU22_10295, partial [Eubacteriales bacterium]|nr:hypothetical protein [Eubacteriales bacterium]